MGVEGKTVHSVIRPILGFKGTVMQDPQEILKLSGLLYNVRMNY